MPRNYWKLSEIHRCIVGDTPKIIHRAKADVLMMKEIFRSMHFGYLDFLRILSENSNYIDLATCNGLNSGEINDDEKEIMKLSANIVDMDRASEKITNEYKALMIECET